MQNAFDGDPLVQAMNDGVGDSGLAVPSFYDWPAHLEGELRQYHPGAVVVMLGGNDGQNFINNGTYVAFDSALWHTVYSERVAALMNVATNGGAHVFWVGMPIMGDSYLSWEMGQEDEVYAQQAAIHPGVTYFSSWSLFTNSAGRYSAYLPNSSGQLVDMRTPDGVHLTGAGADYLADAMVAPMERAFSVKLIS